MNLEILSPDLWLGLAKVTILLLTGFIITLIFHAPRLRVITWSVVLVSLLPVFFLASDHEFSFLKIIPQANNTTDTPTSIVVDEEPISFSNETEIITLPTSEQSPSQIESAAPSLETSPTKNTPYLTYLYFTGLILTLLPLAVSYFRIFRLPKTPATGLPLSIWEQIQKGRKKSPQLNFTPSPSAPFSSGILLPKVLLPSESQEWTHGRLNSCLLHEAAHLKNHDPLTRAISAVIRAIFWFHPLVWYAHRELIQAQEQICDQHALRNGIEPENYAEDLLAAASHSHLTPSEALSMAKWSQIGNRIRYILHPSALKSVTAGQMRTLFGLLLAIPLTLASIGFASEKEDHESASKTENTPSFELLSRSENKAHILSSKEAQAQELADFINKLRDEGITKLTLSTREQPKKTKPWALLSHSGNKAHILSSKEAPTQELAEFIKDLQEKGVTELTLTTQEEPKNNKSLSKLEKATAVILIHPETATLQLANQGLHEDYIMEEIPQIINNQSLTIAAKIVRNDFKNDNDAINFLKKHITTTSPIGTDLVEITAYHKDSEKAVQIANIIANAYLTRRNNDAKRLKNSALGALNESLADQETLVAEKRKKLTTLLRKYDIPYDNKPLTKAELNKRLLSQSDNDELDHSLKENEYNVAFEDYETGRDMLREMKIQQQTARVILKMPHSVVTIHKLAQ